MKVNFLSDNSKIAEKQKVTYQFWSDDRFEFILSDYVIDEIEDGNKTQAAKRLPAIKGLSRLLVKKIDIDLAKQLIKRKVMPEKAFIDAVHVVVAARNAIPTGFAGNTVDGTRSVPTTLS